MSTDQKIKDLIIKKLFSIETASPLEQRNLVVICAKAAQELHEGEIKRLRSLYDKKLKQFIRDHSN